MNKERTRAMPQNVDLFFPGLSMKELEELYWKHFGFENIACSVVGEGWFSLPLFGNELANMMQCQIKKNGVLG